MSELDEASFLLPIPSEEAPDPFGHHRIHDVFFGYDRWDQCVQIPFGNLEDVVLLDKAHLDIDLVEFA